MNKTIAIVDDHNLFAQSLKILVNSLQEYAVISVFKNGQELIDYFSSHSKHPDIVLLDIRMPILNGMETMEWLKEKYLSQKVLALTMEHEEEVLIKMIKAGCRGYLLKDIEPEEFFFALNCVGTSGYYLNEDFSTALKCPEEKTFKKFSSREIEFINLACSERTYKQVAEEMKLSPKTIDGYREALFQKLELKSRVGLVLFAVKNKMVSF